MLIKAALRCLPRQQSTPLPDAPRLVRGKASVAGARLTPMTTTAILEREMYTDPELRQDIAELRGRLT